MLRHRLLQEGEPKPYLVIAISVGTNVLLGVLIFALFALILSQRPPAVSRFLNVIASVISILMPALIILTFIALSKLKSRQIRMVELKKIKTFIDALHHSSTDIEAYDTLRDFISMLRVADKISIVYKARDEDDGFSWKDISAEDAAACDMHYEFCPLLNKSRDYICGTPNSDSGCPLDTKKFRKGSYLCVPIVDEEHYKSILQLYKNKDGSFSQATIAAIKSYVEIARPIISIKNEFNALNRKATTDYLTKLYNRDFLDTYLQNQIEVSNLSKQPLSIIMIDVDCFKAINDTYGHASGDYLLIHVSEIFMKCIRKTDVVVRYGGDEFVVILPSTDTKTAFAVSERMRINLEKSMIRSLDGNNVLFATCSFGISTYPTLCGSKQELLKTADIALYKAKHSNKNCTMIYEKGLTAIQDSAKSKVI